MKKLLALLLALVMVLGLFAACGNNDANTTTEGSKDSTTQGSSDDGTTEAAPKELKTLRILAQSYNTFSEYQHVDYWTQNYQMMYGMAQLEELGIKLEFETYEDEQYESAASARIQAGIDLPDIFKRAGALSAKDLYDAGIAANIKDILDAYDTDNSVRDFWTKWAGGTITTLMDGDGNIYEMPYVFNRQYKSEKYDGLKDSPHGLSVRRDWVTAIGEEWNDIMTVDEVVDLLIKIRENDGNGNGAQDEVLGTRVDTFGTGLEAGFGMIAGLIGNYTGEEITCNLYHENFPKYIQALQKLYNAGLIDLSVPYTDITTAVIYSNRGVSMFDYAAAYWTEQNIAGYEMTADYQWIILDEDKDPTTGWYLRRDGSVATYGGPSISAEADPEAIAILFDWFYSEERRILFSYGMENLSWEMGEDGEPVSGVEGLTYDLVDGKRVNKVWATEDEKWAAYEAKMAELGITDYGEIRAFTDWQGNVNANGLAHVRCWVEDYDNIIIQKYDKSDHGGYLGCVDTYWLDGEYAQYSTYQIVTGENAMMTAEEQEKWNEVYTTVETYVSELIMGLITGQKSLDDLDTYLAEVEGLGLTDMIEIQKAQHARFMAAN